jgi:hypothetical protein
VYGHTQPFILGLNVASNPVLISCVSTEAFIEKSQFSSGIVIIVVTIFSFQFSSVTIKVTS